MSTSFKEINSKSLINLTSDILISYPFSLPLQICIFSTCAKIHIILGNIYSAPLLFLATPSSWIFQTTFHLHCCSQGAFTPSPPGHTSLHANLMRQACKTGVIHISQIRKLR